LVSSREAQPEHLLIDGYNLIKTIPHFRQREQVSLEAARQTLEQALRSYALATDTRITLIFDGDTALDGDTVSESSLPQHKKEPVEILFSHAPEKADDLLKKAVQQRHGAKNLRLVTSDREICRFARRHKIRSTSSAEFADELDSRPHRQTEADVPPPLEFDPDIVLDADEVDAWERLFRAGDTGE
jgi:predicted RNA-binding protein with PIN domain